MESFNEIKVNEENIIVSFGMSEFKIEWVQNTTTMSWTQGTNNLILTKASIAIHVIIRCMKLIKILFFLSWKLLYFGNE